MCRVIASPIAGSKSGDVLSVFQGCWPLLLLVSAIPRLVSAQPTVATAAAAVPNPVTSTTAALMVLGADPGGEAGLTYSWSATGPASVIFSSNNTNAAKSTTATFRQAGNYTISVLIKNSSGASVSSNVAVTVNPTASRVTINPSSATVMVNSSQQFTAVVVDQFGNTMAPPANSTGWTDLTKTHLQSACPPDYYNGINYPFYSLCPYVINAWDGATADTKRNRMIIWGGGHNNYWGNEVFSLNLNANPPSLTLLTEPSAFASGCPEANPDGTPVARETFNGLVYLPIQDRMLSFDGGKAPCGSDSGHTWDLDLSATPPIWHARDPVNGFNPAPIAAAGSGSVTGSACDYDPNSQAVYCVWSGIYELLRYSYITNTWSQLTGYSSTLVPLGSTPVIDPVRKLMIFIGDDYHVGNPKVMAIDISPGSAYIVQDWTNLVTGCSGLAGVDYPGLAYDSVLDKIVGWPGTGNTVYIFDPDTKTCTAQTYANGPTNITNNNGVFGRFRYFPSLNAHAVVSDANVDAYLLRVSSAGMGWLVNGGGHISGSGSFTAGTVAGGPYIISATVGGVTGTATVMVGGSGPPPLLQIHADATEVSGVSNGSTITPSIAPSGLAGTVVVNGSGSVNYAAGDVGNGVYFQNCCSNTNDAYYHFTGTGVGTAFKVSQGQITFSLKSRYSFAQRASGAAAPRYAFDVRDGNGRHLFYFTTQVNSGVLSFSYLAAGTGASYYVPPGTEDILFGNGVILKVTILWQNGVARLYLNNNIAQSATSTLPTPNWSGASVFDLGAFEYQASGGFNVSDDIIDEFTVTGPGGGGGGGTDTTPPMVSLTAPTNGSTVNGTVTVSANATDNVAVGSVQFQLDGTNLGAAVTGSGPTYSTNWNTTTALNGTHTLSAVAQDTSGNTATSTISVTVSNMLPAPTISSVQATLITSSRATITWTTDQASSSQVAYGTTTAYGSTIPLVSTLVTSHAVNLTGLNASTVYHFQVQSANSQGNLASSTDYTFTTAATLLQIHADATEVSGVTNGSTITLSIAPPGLGGTVVVNGSGSVNYAAGDVGNGVYFQNCCSNTNDAYYHFTGTGVGTVFNVSQGQITFSLKSRYSFAQRASSAATPRYAFDVRDGNGNHMFYFLTQVNNGVLYFTYLIAGTGQYYWLPQGTEDSVYGNGAILRVTMSWNSGVANLYLNGTLVKSTTYTTPTPNWSGASVFDLGAFEYQSFGGFNVSDDIIDEFTVLSR
ncbi:MAG TPA: Ig-like domain-containing protein [Candidatus Sulfotelmatobacter sp.]|nr:Ig-like domain-containing protein [Candidatus Sulfotelmatobacter sp.]